MRLTTLLVVIALVGCCVATPQCNFNPFGAATPYNLFALGAVNGCNSDVEGRIAAAGPVTLENYSVGLKLQLSQNYTLYGCDSVSLTHGSVLHGGIYGKTVTANNIGITIGGNTYTAACCSDNTCNACTTGNSCNIDFASANSYFQSLSSAWASQPTSAGATVQTSGPSVNLNCGTATGTVFFSNVQVIAGITEVNIQCPPTASVVINYTPSTNAFNYIGVNLKGGITASTLIHSFSSASITINTGVPGSVFAPASELYFPQGVINGQVIVKSLQAASNGGCAIGQFNHVPFIGCVPGVTQYHCCIYQRGIFENSFCSDAACVSIPNWHLTNNSLVNDCSDCCVC